MPLSFVGDELHEGREYHEPLDTRAPVGDLCIPMPLAPLSRLPKGVLALMKEVAKGILRRPVIGIAAAARTRDGKWVLIQRADTGTWALPGGTLEWGETLRECIAREMVEEAGIAGVVPKRVVGVYSRPDRDPRFHGVTVVVLCDVEPPAKDPVNPVEILGVGLFADADVPELAFGMRDMLDAARRGGEAELE
jgi:8-oxo-dGTP diphosphatase